jgi:hypothetical protein
MGKKKEHINNNRGSVVRPDGKEMLYLLRVGADYTYLGGGFHSHISPDNSYIFIPIPDYENKQKAITYQNYRWQNQLVLGYLPRRIRNVDAPNQYVHNDPEFKTFTYGSPQFKQNGGQDRNYGTLKQMQKGDMLTFYAAFTTNGHGIKGYYFFAYFIVDRAITYCNPDEITVKERALVANNHHFIHGLKNQVIIKGDSQQTRVFERAVLLSSCNENRRRSNYYPCKIIKGMLGYDKSMNLSSIRKICLPQSEIAQFKQYLDENGG